MARQLEQFPYRRDDPIDLDGLGDSCRGARAELYLLGKIRQPPAWSRSGDPLYVLDTIRDMI